MYSTRTSSEAPAGTNRQLHIVVDKPNTVTCREQLTQSHLLVVTIVSNANDDSDFSMLPCYHAWDKFQQQRISTQQFLRTVGYSYAVWFISHS